MGSHMRSHTGSHMGANGTAVTGSHMEWQPTLKLIEQSQVREKMGADGLPHEIKWDFHMGSHMEEDGTPITGSHMGC